MANKVKLKCGACGKMFKANKTQPLCDECERKRRQMKANAPAPTAKVTSTLTNGKPQWLAASTERDPASLHEALSGLPPVPRSKPTRPTQTTGGQQKFAGTAATVIAPKVKAVSPQPIKKVPVSPIPPYVPTAEEIHRIEQRYLTLAQPEFDGIRTQIAHELQIPKRVVKEVVAALRTHMQLPSWWDARPYMGTPEQLQQIRDAYLPALPQPPVGIHKQIAAELNLSKTLVYQGIFALRKELNLPTDSVDVIELAKVE